MSPVVGLLSACIGAYRLALRPLLPANCRYTPGCSDYAVEALKRREDVCPTCGEPLRGGWLAARRVCRCHPWGGFGYDPVPGDPLAARMCAADDATKRV